MKKPISNYEKNQKRIKEKFEEKNPKRKKLTTLISEVHDKTLDTRVFQVFIALVDVGNKRRRP
jgi:hypothetical protein